MVIAHASVLAQEGETVYVLMDDGDARRRAKREQAWLERHDHAEFVLWSTRQVIEQAGDRPGWIKGEHTWRQVYVDMRNFDDGLPPL